ncbi:hypothetical protein ABH991_005316 [Bradyrhizobium ottawaense]
MSISREPPRTFRPLGVFRRDDRLGAAGDSAGLPDPGEQDDALVGEEVGQRLADRLLLPAQALVVGGHEAGHQADIGLRQLTASVRHRVEADVERALAHRGELRVGLDQRRVRIDLGGDVAVAALADFGSEHAAEPVPEITFVDGAARELVRDFQRGRGLRGAGAEAENGGCGDRGREQMAAREHGVIPLNVSSNGSCWRDLGGSCDRHVGPS